MKPYSLHHAIAWLGPLSTREAARVMRCSTRHVARLMRGQPLGRDEEGRIAIGAPTLTERRAVRAIRPLLDGDPVYADWLSEVTGYSRRAVYAALRDLGYSCRRGRGAMWQIEARAAK